MNNDGKDLEKESEKKEEKKFYKSKDQILDESFKKAELIKTGQPEKKHLETIVRKPFIKIGIFIAIFAIIGLFLINYIPTMYIYYETDYGSIEEFYSYKEFENNQIEHEEIYSLFESTCYNCSDNTESYIGLTINDFKETPKITIYVFYFLLIIGAIFTLFIIIDRKKDFPENTITIVHSIFTTLFIVAGIIILLTNIKFLDAYLLQQLNKPFIQALGFNRVQLIFFMPYILILFSLVLFIFGLILIRLNLNKAVNKLHIDKLKKPDISYKYGSKL